MNTKQKTARIVGILFIVGTAAGILSNVFLGPFLDDPNYLISISENENQIVIGTLLILVMGFALAMVPVMLYPIFKKQNEVLALGAVVFRGALETAVYIALGINWLLLLILSQEYVIAGNMDSTTFQTLGAVMLKADGWMGHILSIVFSLGAVMIYTIFYQSRLIPRWLSGWGLIGAILYLAAPLFAMFGIALEFLMMPLFIQELALGIWLIVRGFNSIDSKQENIVAKKRAVPLWLNRVMKFALRTPLHGIVSGKIMLLTFTGRKSGKTYTIPVSYTQHGSSVMMFTNHIWWKNLVDHAQVMLHLRGRQLKATVDLNTDDVEQIAPVLAEHLRDKPTDAPIHNVTYDDTGEPVAAEVKRAAGNVRMVRFKLA